jgi:hypothetical protein
MPPIATPQGKTDPGSATVRDLRDHWQVSEDTAAGGPQPAWHRAHRPGTPAVSLG